MYYIPAPKTEAGSPRIYLQDITIIDVETGEEVLTCESGDVLNALTNRGIQPQLVVGLYKKGSTLIISPIEKMEVNVLKLLKDPYFVMRDKLGGKGAKPVHPYGLYNFTMTDTRYGTSGLESSYSIAKLLLDNCGELYDGQAIGVRIETTKEYIAVCIADNKHQSVYLRFDITDWNALTRLYAKYQMLHRKSDVGYSFKIEIAG